MTLPNFLIGGPPKCASTSLYFYLQQHPEIFMSPVKQTRFFSVDYDLGFDYYLKTYFSGITNEKAAGEATPGYFLLPFVAPRIKEFNPDMKLIFCLRNPVERAFSGWSMRVNNGTENLSFRDALLENMEHKKISRLQNEATLKEWTREQKETGRHDDSGYRTYVEGSMYAHNLKNYYRYFDPSQVKIIFLESLKNDFTGTMKNIFSFLGVDENFIVQNTEQKNTNKKSKIKILNSPAGKKLLRKVSGIAPKFLKKKIFDTMYVKGGEVSKSKLTADDRKFAYKIFKDDIEELEQLLKKDLSHWKISENEPAAFS